MDDASFYMPIRKFSLLNSYFAIVDMPEYLADSLFVHNEVEVFFGDEYHHKDWEYVVVFCHVRKWNVKKFKKAMSMLPSKMMLWGHGDYLSVCNMIWKTIRDASGR